MSYRKGSCHIEGFVFHMEAFVPHRGVRVTEKGSVSFTRVRVTQRGFESHRGVRVTQKGSNHHAIKEQ